MKENPYVPPDSTTGRVRTEPRWHVPLHWFLAAIQIAQAVIQRIEIAIYDSRISRYMPTMAEPDKSNWIQWQFETFAIGLPAMSQFLLLPALILLSLNRTYSTGLKATYCVVAICLDLFTWYNSFIASVYTIGTFD